MGVWAAVDRWEAARARTTDPVLLGLLERHSVWHIASSGFQKLVCNTCHPDPEDTWPLHENTWPCIVFTEVELMLKQQGGAT
jgi:hypothetical protein